MESSKSEEFKTEKTDLFFAKFHPFSFLSLLTSFRLDQLFEEFYLSEFQKVMATQFIQEHLAVKENCKLERIQEWFLMRFNDKNIQEYCDPFQVGCPEIIPQLTASPFWSFF